MPVPSKAGIGVCTGSRFVVAVPMMGLIPPEVPVNKLMAALTSWFGTSVAHAFGDPRQDRLQRPPNVGVQPYRDHPHKG